MGAGPRVRASNFATLRVHVLVQSWDGRVVTHDTWRYPGRSEPLPAGDLGKIVFSELQGQHVGDVVELVFPETAGVPGIRSTTVMLVELDDA